jgi:hypothetical protein
MLASADCTLRSRKIVVCEVSGIGWRDKRAVHENFPLISMFRLNLVVLFIDIYVLDL